ncbi:hypothetical protein QO209_10915 [Pseudomonas citronellolis]|uniref:hypothetical protein n=1 Tax=Pseudomonas citronellolis TaxID=53408 RepID=UPI002649F836|nr:hypothetical protein [Pseudomonas citronellolis]MDN6872957.1 hypothetical protein [Pseudomonas citronellolis]
MAFEITYLDYDELVTFKTDSLCLASDRVLTSDNGEMMPHLVLRAIDLETGEVINDLLGRMQGAPEAQGIYWWLRCLTIYPALLCLKQIACTYRGGKKARHFAGAAKFAASMRCSPYTEDELKDHMVGAWRCYPVRYPMIHQLIPANQLAAFTDGAWTTLNRGEVSIAGQDEESVRMLRLFKLLP